MATWQLCLNELFAVLYYVDHLEAPTPVSISMPAAMGPLTKFMDNPL